MRFQADPKHSKRVIAPADFARHVKQANIRRRGDFKVERASEIINIKVATVDSALEVGDVKTKKLELHSIPN
jgi:hypothetical protein